MFIILDIIKIERLLLSNKKDSCRYLITLTNKITSYSTNFVYTFYTDSELDDVYLLDTLINDSRYGLLTFNNFIKVYGDTDFSNIDFLLEEHTFYVLLNNKLSNLIPNYLDIWSVV